MAIFAEARYDWFRYTGDRKVNIKTGKKTLTLSKGLKFGAREATSTKGHWRVILPGDKTRVFTLNPKQAALVGNRAVHIA